MMVSRMVSIDDTVRGRTIRRGLDGINAASEAR